MNNFNRGQGFGKPINRRPFNSSTRPTQEQPPYSANRPTQEQPPHSANCPTQEQPPHSANRPTQEQPPHSANRPTQEQPPHSANRPKPERPPYRPSQPPFRPGYRPVHHAPENKKTVQPDNPGNDKLDDLVNTASKHLNTSPEELKNAAQSGNMQKVFSQMTPSQAQQLQKILSDENAAKKLLSSPQAQALLRRLSKNE